MACPYCGAHHSFIKLIYCEKCGKVIQTVCTQCGEIIDESACCCEK